MADREHGRDVVETVSIHTASHTSASELERFATPVEDFDDYDDSEPTTPKAERADEERRLGSGPEGVPAAAALAFTAPEETPKAERVRPRQSVTPPAASEPAAVTTPTASSETAARGTAVVAPTLAAEAKPAVDSQPSESASASEKSEKDVERGVSDNATVSSAEKAEAKEHAKEKGPNIVDWDGPDDPELPTNWRPSKKWSIVATLSLLSFISPLASSMFAPGVPEVLAEFQTTGEYLQAFVVSIYILGYAAGPIFIAPLSELYGRTIMYHACNVFFICFTVGCALSTNVGMLIGFRFLAGIGGSGVLTMGAGTLSDLFIQEERGRAMAIWASGPLIGPVAGPIAGGFLAQAKGWRWIFWVITIGAGFTALLMLAVLSESYGTIILERRTQKRRKETGNPNLRSALDSGLSPGDAFRQGIVRPLKMLIFSPIVLLLTIYNAVIYGYLYLLFTTITEIFIYDYGFTQGTAGLSFIGIGVGMFLGLVIFGGISDVLLKRRAKKGEMKPEYRLLPMIPVAAFVPVGLFVYGWTAEKKVFWFWPIFGSSFLGFGLLGVFMCIQTYLVDAYTRYAASAVAANTIFRSLVGALLPLAGPSMYTRLGLGWGNSLLGFIATAMIPIPWLFYTYGERIRKNPRFQLNW